MPHDFGIPSFLVLVSHGPVETVVAECGTECQISLKYHLTVNASIYCSTELRKPRAPPLLAPILLGQDHGIHVSKHDGVTHFWSVIFPSMPFSDECSVGWLCGVCRIAPTNGGISQGDLTPSNVQQRQDEPQSSNMPVYNNLYASFAYAQQENRESLIDEPTDGQSREICSPPLW